MNELFILHSDRVEREVVLEGVAQVDVGHVEVAHAITLIGEAVEVLRDALMVNAIQLDVLDSDPRGALARRILERTTEAAVLSRLLESGSLTEAAILG